MISAKHLGVAAIAAFVLPATVLADDPPPANAMKLSEVVAGVEQQAGANLAYIESVDWDDDGYWEVEYYTTSREEVEMKIDPVSGAAR